MTLRLSMQMLGIERRISGIVIASSGYAKSSLHLMATVPRVYRAMNLHLQLRRTRSRAPIVTHLSESQSGARRRGKSCVVTARALQLADPIEPGRWISFFSIVRSQKRS